MHVTCKCLNVSIKSRSAELQRVNVELTDVERADAFFREDLASVPELEKITKEQPGLMEKRNVGSWIVHRCCNCSMYTHAVHREYGAALVLINNNILLSPEEINKLKANPDYSPVFRVVINHSLEDLDDYLQQPKFSVSQLPNTVQVALDGLQQQLQEAVQRQTMAIEDKIRVFTAEQHQLLEQFRERAHNEHRLLSKLVCKGEETNTATSNIETPPTTPDGFKSTLTISAANTKNSKSNIISNDTKVSSGPNIKHETTVRHSSKSTINNKSSRKRDQLYICTKESSSFDTEVLFPFEEMENTDATSQQLLYSSEDTDGSDMDDSSQNEEIHMSRGQRDGHSTLAKSLPVVVPVFPSIVHRAVQDQDDDQLPTEPHNIRASMKALAKSVNSDTVFGDLPRPRFSTQI
ncbi:PREDICTED: uncharacterized protein LOC105459964 isoform X1 [Wasmannia auropunctata]|uniref:uncharacterized protein LOC105459964 isoform X1 n=2 Tax=Wasmannia auropunctata TaxID=64793 RepID=UPI0005EE6C02|nr:PREDICTED: uncharacterized protein LOC105459964 isoform X1 [Wasmannia auropunctata]XP_011704658.1 PREDICTED: uncharacterized protein LOC105459964 isoform X1 [Wasmannia auropunctata]